MLRQKLVRTMDIVGYISMIFLIPLWVFFFLIASVALWLARRVGLRTAEHGLPEGTPQVLMIFMFLLSVGYLVGGTITMTKSIQLVKSGVVTIGTVTDIDAIRSNRYPVISYNVSGRTYTINERSPFGTTLKAGDLLPVRYDPATPEQGAANTFNGLWVDPLSYGWMGLMCGGVAWYIFRDKKRGLGIQGRG